MSTPREPEYPQVPPGAPLSGPPLSGPPLSAVGGFPPATAAMSGRADFGAALNWSWLVFRNRPGPMILPGVLMFAVTVAVTILIVLAVVGMLGASATDSGTGIALTATSAVLAIVAILVVVIATLFLRGAVLSGVLKVADGRPVSARDFLVPVRFGAFLVTIILVGLAVLVGLILLVVPGLIAIFAFQYAPVMVLDQRLTPVQALTASAKLAFGTPGDSLIVLIGHYVYGYVGGLAMGLGAILTVPMGEAFVVHCYRSLTHRPLPSWVE